MKNSIILHHYENSPYAEKIRLMFGLADCHWYSLLSPVWPPRPNVDPLTGGYRRIPVAQLGADIFCDTSLIAEEVALAANCDRLAPAAVDEEALTLMRMAEQEAFFAAIAAVPPLRLLGTMLQQFGPVGMYRFVKDRSGMMQGSTVATRSAGESKQVLTSLFNALEARLENNAWVGGEEASIADFAVYHPLWLHVNCKRSPLEASASVCNWFDAVSDIGHGQREETTTEAVFELARNSEPRALPESAHDSAVAIGDSVEVAPADYGMVPVVASLAAVTETRIILARETADFGLLHVHFPREGYRMTPVA